MLNKSLKEIGVGVRELLVRSKHEGAVEPSDTAKDAKSASES